jgi:hypothetical protein
LKKDEIKRKRSKDSKIRKAIENIEDKTPDEKKFLKRGGGAKYDPRKALKDA